MVAEPIEDYLDEPEWLQSQPPAIPGPLRRELVRTDLDEQSKRAKPNQYRYHTAHQLKTDQEYWGWMMLEYQCRQDAMPDVDLSYGLYVARTNLELIERAQNRLKAIQRDSGTHPALVTDRYADIDFSAIKRAVPLDSFITRIAQGHPSNRSVTRYKLHCMLPGHTEDHTPSMTVYLDQETCWCFGCSRGGDVIELARHYFACGNNAASADFLCRYMGIEVPRIATRRVQPADSGRAPSSDGIVSFNAARLARGRRRGY